MRLVPGLTIAIEPMVNVGKPGIRTMPDRWTVVTVDGTRSAHFEHTIAITENGPRVLTAIAAPAASLTVPLMLPFSDWATTVRDRSALNNNAIMRDDTVNIVLELVIGPLLSVFEN